MLHHMTLRIVMMGALNNTCMGAAHRAHLHTVPPDLPGGVMLGVRNSSTHWLPSFRADARHPFTRHVYHICGLAGEANPQP